MKQISSFLIFSGLFFIVFSGGLNISWSPLVIHGRDSACYSGKQKAARDVKAGVFLVKMPNLVMGRELYAEEIFMKYFGLTVTLRQNNAYRQFGNVSKAEEYFLEMETAQEDCYYKYIDSILVKKYGTGVFNRVISGADSLHAAQPERYDPITPDRAIYLNGDSALRADLMKNIVFPPSAKKDSVTGTVFLKIEIDTTGKVSKVSVMRGVREDLNKAAVEGAYKLTGFQPPLRRGKKIPSSVIQPVKFKI
ncbi:MAG TPA: energy transducer TonB [Bacteroidia bacterium]|nr:energy transducer TonB [Bacteroidia bacterium]